MTKAPDEAHAEAAEIVVLDEVVQVDGQQLEADAQVAAEDEMVLQGRKRGAHRHCVGFAQQQRTRHCMLCCMPHPIEDCRQHRRQAVQVTSRRVRVQSTFVHLQAAHPA